ncbi:unnamed protein product [Clonostachys rhizophaga]|uniref:DUF7770 domain-containing protein n=1 Tax=Clonostachys rhizophaga TaxID=160324 RepID=A0A9N9VN95_9HYPO|nr:unnamed protein product [Clonostachys rhizophaga]
MSPDIEEVQEEVYNITQSADLFPTEFLAARCSAIYLELLDPNRHRTAETGEFPLNHASLKIDFEEPVSGYRGLCLDVQLAEDEPSHDGEHNPRGVVCIKLVRWTHRSPSSLRTLRIRSKDGLLFGEIFNLIVNKRMIYFSFISDDRQFFGCRDFIAQVISVLESEGLVESKLDRNETKDMLNSISTVYDVLGRRFGQGYDKWCPIYKGEFLLYTHINLDKIEYSRVPDFES